jgi:hypothetical protein
MSRQRQKQLCFLRGGSYLVVENDTRNGECQTHSFASKRYFLLLHVLLAKVENVPQPGLRLGAQVKPAELHSEIKLA